MTNRSTINDVNSISAESYDEIITQAVYSGNAGRDSNDII
jgi:hypothetical protein